MKQVPDLEEMETERLVCVRGVRGRVDRNDVVIKDSETWVDGAGGLRMGVEARPLQIPPWTRAIPSS